MNAKTRKAMQQIVAIGGRITVSPLLREKSILKNVPAGGSMVVIHVRLYDAADVMIGILEEFADLNKPAELDDMICMLAAEAQAMRPHMLSQARQSRNEIRRTIQKMDHPNPTDDEAGL